MTERPNKELALRYWSDPTLQAWYWHGSLERWMSHSTPSFTETVPWHVGHKAPTEPPVKMCELAGVKFPMPMSARRADGDDYYVASPQSVDQHTWRNDSADEEWLSLHICHTTREAAEAHSQAMRAVNAQAVAKAKEQA